MKALTRTLGLLILSILVFNDSMAQQASVTTNRGLTIGLGTGMAYQKSDLANSKGFGFDFTLGSQIYKKENAFVSVDWKFRLLAGENKAYDHRINPDNTYSNIRYRFNNYDFEVGLTLNRLRERTGIVLTGFAGAGLTHGRTSTDLFDAGNNLYDYSGIDPNQDSKLICEDLRTLSDGDFETRLVNKAAILPTAGCFIGYQFSTSLTVGFGFKTNFYLTEHNSVVGIDLDNRVMEGSGLDRNNYVSAGVNWKFRGGASRNRRGSQNSSDVTNHYSNTTRIDNSVVPVSLPHPSVKITDPSADSYHTVSYAQTIRATVNNVSGSGNISFYQNGFPNNRFTYNVNTKIFTANVTLRDGENSIRIMATNQSSTAEDMVIITLDNPGEAAKPAPWVGFTSPSEERITSSSDRIDLTASVKEISSKQDIYLMQNGSNIPFEFNPVSGLVKTSVVLTNGDNNLIIKGFNESGSAQDQITVYFNNPEKIPVPTVRFVNPVVPETVNYNRFPMSAVTQNVRGRNDVRLTLNGASIGNFSFSANGGVSVNLLLSDGVNIIEIFANNEAGFASESTSVTYHEPVYYEPVYQEPVYNEPVYNEPVIRSSPPVINIISPATNPLRTYEQSLELRATVLNVHSKENITLNLNGISTRNFNFSNSTKVLTTRVALREGENVLTINAQNESGGYAKDQVFLKETRPCLLPEIRLIDPAQRQTNTNQQIYTIRAEVRNIANSDQLRLTVNGKAVSFNFNNNLLSCSVPLISGLNTLTLNARNECGEDISAARITYSPPVETDPCTPPKVFLTLNEVNRDDATHEITGTISGVKNKADISLTLNGKAYEGFQFVPATGVLASRFKLTPGSHTIVVSVKNACGTDSKSVTVNRDVPCTPPTVSLTLNEVNRDDATHEIRGLISGVKNIADISLTLNGRAYTGFTFFPATGDLSAKFQLTPGSHTIVVSVKNPCGADSETESVSVEEKACGPRINPGNAAWQFCLVTPSGTYSRENLTNPNFTYSGPASSLYFMPIAGGGDAIVGGKPYAIRSGQYYLFTGRLNVTVSTKNPGSMGQWSVCISADRAPVSGNGNNRPKSPCEEEKEVGPKGNGNKR